jgi:hypothetical protein
LLSAILLAGVYFASREFSAIVERVGAPSPVSALTVDSRIAPQAARRMDGVCADTLASKPTAEALRYCGLVQLVDRPDETQEQRLARYATGADYLEGSLNRSPFNGATWLYLATAELAHGDRAAAADAFDTSYEVDAIAAGMTGMRLGVGLKMLDALSPITRWSLDSEIVTLGTRNPRYLLYLAKTSNRLRYVASALGADPQVLARFIRIVREPPPGVRR